MFRVIFAAVAVALTALWLFLWRVPFGFGNWKNVAPHDFFWPAGAWLLPIGVVVIFGGAASLSVYDRFKRAKSRKEQTNSTVTALVCLAIVGMLWPWALLGPGQPKLDDQPDKVTASNIVLEGRFNIIAAMWSDVATEYFGAAYTFDDARAYARNYAATQQNPTERAQAHIATHPPGAVLWFYGVRKLYESSPLLQSSMTGLAQTMTGQTQDDLATGARLLRATAPGAIGSKIVPPPLPATAIGAALLCAILLGLSLVAALPAVYGMAALGGGDNAEKRGLLAAALWILAPTTNLFAFTLDALVACGAAWTLYLAALAWNRMAQSSGFAPASKRSPDSRLEAGAGPAMSIDIRTSKSFNSADFYWVAAGAILALTTFVSIGALAVAAVLVGALLIYRPRGGARAALLGGGAFVAVWILLALWGGFNPLEIALNAGRAHRFATLETRRYWPWVWLNLAFWALFIGWPTVALLARGVTLYQETSASARTSARANAVGICLGIATLSVLVLLSLSGNVRGETERLWLFALAPVCALAVSGQALRWKNWAALLALQALQTLLMAAMLAPLVRPY